MPCPGRPVRRGPSGSRLSLAADIHRRTKDTGYISRRPRWNSWRGAPNQSDAPFLVSRNTKTYASGMTISVFSVLVMIVGLLVWLISQNGTLKTIGLACFTAGLAAALVVLGSGVVRIR
jgi:hypothetical protein